MSQVPRIRWNIDPLPTGNGDKTTIWNRRFEALLASEEHYRLPGGRWSGGGPFYVVRATQRHTTVPLSWMSVGSRYDGHATGVVGLPTFPSYSALVKGTFPSFAQQTGRNAGRYATGWARTRPGNPVASVGQFIIELRDLPRLPLNSLFKGRHFGAIGREARSRMRWFRSLGSEYLNVEFGWKPFVRDLQQAYRLMKTIDKQIAQLRRDNGKGIRRSGTVEEDRNTTQKQSTYSSAFVNTYGAPPNWTAGNSVWTVTTTTELRSWFSACYMYWIMDTLDWKWEARARAALFGALPTPELLWEVLPWSWLVDWFVNVGDVMSNASVNAVDNLVALYSYIMTTERTTVTATCETSWQPKYNSTSPPTRIPGGGVTLSSEYVKETKVRLGGSPFGLGISYSGLSARQLGILAALGLSRGNF